ncbi:hypothetical protein SODALDRAFT_184633 [Sodiomyces alkalinus F11]|uniref:Uncharacterized protein n=1 Tax=Sodiomyces alkalinus (strain CBS 110278 / VKM F-3762 / F11) TaxID=1314773 RepID=A0A3N2PV68_SODAK|nr:hypothetical protein SODALDRAFT_184633 [Sodiomyces alkalinus F11]ROT38236.1 hypothetical protein SODALDRAFT_184633 [Sodiomyces alkalinus F11]
MLGVCRIHDRERVPYLGSSTSNRQWLQVRRVLVQLLLRLAAAFARTIVAISRFAFACARACPPMGRWQRPRLPPVSVLYTTSILWPRRRHYHPGK